MRKYWTIVFGVLFLGAIVLSACSPSAATTAPAGNETKESESSQAGENPTPPAPYSGKTNPLAGNADAVTAGKTIYDTNCATCHGTGGKGDGPGGAALNPKPADLTDMSPTDDTDAYIFWRISEGGAMAPFNSGMPAWKGTLNENQIWQSVTYLRSLEK